MGAPTVRAVAAEPRTSKTRERLARAACASQGMSRMITSQGVSHGVRDGRMVGRAAALFPPGKRRWTHFLVHVGLALWFVLLGGIDDAGRIVIARAYAGAPQYVYDMPAVYT